MTLVLHAGGYSASRSDINLVPTPSATATHTPISHAWFLDQILYALNTTGYEITDQKYGLNGQKGEDFFGVLTLGNTGPDGDFAHVLGLRNSHRHRFSAQAVLGTRVFVCDNLAFRGNDAIMKFSRKHTSYIVRDFPKICMDKIAELPSYFRDTEQQVNAWKNFDLANREWMALPDGTEISSDSNPDLTRMRAADICMNALTKGATNGRLLPHVWKEWSREDGPGGHTALKGTNLWSLFNAFTEVEKRSDSPSESQRRTARLSSMLDGVVIGDHDRFVNAEPEPVLDIF